MNYGARSRGRRCLFPCDRRRVAGALLGAKRTNLGEERQDGAFEAGEPVVTHNELDISP
jgi:hypothetical protein